MRIGAGANADNGAASTGSMGDRFQKAMDAESGKSGMTPTSMTGASAPAGGATQTADMAQALEGIVTQMKELIQQLAQLIQSMSNKGGGGGQINGASSVGEDGSTKSVDGAGASGPGASGLGGSQGPSARIPAPTENVRDIQLGSKTMTIGSDGSASAAEVDSAAAEMQRMYDSSPTFRQTIDNAGSEKLTVTLGRRGDNTSWGGGGRVFLNLNNIEAGNNDRFQGIVGHEFAHAASGLGHGAALDAIESRVRSEA